MYSLFHPLHLHSFLLLPWLSQSRVLPKSVFQKCFSYTKVIFIFLLYSLDTWEIFFAVSGFELTELFWYIEGSIFYLCFPFPSLSNLTTLSGMSCFSWNCWKPGRKKSIREMIRGQKTRHWHPILAGGWETLWNSPLVHKKF